MNGKRITAVLCAALLLCGAEYPAFAAETDGAAQPQVIAVSYADIEQTVLSNNQTVHANSKTLEALQDNDLAEEKQDELSDSSASLQSVSKTLQQTYNTLVSNPSLTTDEQAIAASLQGSIASLNGICSILDGEYDQLDTDGETVEKAELQMQDADDQIVVSAQKLFATYHSLETQRGRLLKQQPILSDLLQAAQTRADLGMITQNDLLNQRQDQYSLQDNLTALANQMQTVKDNLRVLLGYSQDYDLNLSPMPEPDADLIAGMNYDADYQTALAANWTLQEKQKDKDIADESYDNDLESTVDTYNAAALNYEEAKNEFDTMFRQVYNDVGEKQGKLKSAQAACDAKTQKLGALQQEYGLGTASRLDVENAQMDADQAQASLSQAKADLFSSEEQYRWALGGVLSAGSSQS